MPIELSKEHHEVLKKTGRLNTPAELQTLLADAKPRMDLIIKEVMEPAQPLTTTLTELRDLALAVHDHGAALQTKTYGPDKQAGFFNAIRMLDTAQGWFGEGLRTGMFRTRPVQEVLAASRPWRARVKALGEHRYVFEPVIAEQFGDVNSTGTLQEEVDDLAFLNKLIDQRRPELEEVGLTEELVQEGRALHSEAEGRDLHGILGLRNQAEATALRNRILTYAILLGREARAAGINAVFDDADARRRFEAASFRDALRRLRSRRKRGPGAPADDAAEPAPAEDTEPAPVEGAAEPAPV